MKTVTRHAVRSSLVLPLLCLSWLVPGPEPLQAAPATVLFQDDFLGGIPGWTAVQPVGAYVDGPMLWQFDKVNNAFSEQSNIYTDSATASTSRRAVMLISDAAAPPSSGWEYKARLTAGDDDGFGLIFGYQDEVNFYRVALGRQARTGWPQNAVMVDRMSNSVPVDIAGPLGFVNTANRPFDVTIAVTNGLLTLGVVDDPLGAAGGPIPYALVVDQALPTTAIGKVGIFSWGMGAGTPRSFRVQNPVLNGVALDTAAISQVLSNWTFTVTPSSTNDYPTPAGLWSQALGRNGDRGMMIENDDQAPENVAPSFTNTPVRAAVAGDSSWSNYVYSARFQSADNDGFGMLLRWQDRTNWYRIAFRAQSGAPGGIRTGISIQKNVNRTFDQMLATTAFIPPINSAFDVHAAIRDNSLQIMCIQNPDSASPTINSFGPINMAASTKVPANLASGKIGVFSWAQYGDNNLPDTTAPDDGTAVDWVKVRQVNGEGLLVSSAYGTPDPPVGLNDLPTGGSVTCRVDSAVTTAPGVRQLCLGWSGGGSCPAAGLTNEFVVTLAQFSLVSWKWQTQYLLTTSASSGGSVATTLGPWINSGATVTVTATPNPGYVFIGWSGDNRSATLALALTMTRPYTLTAIFAPDTDGDGMADAWEQHYFGNLSQVATGNPDGDSRNNLAEYQIGSNPTVAEGLVLSDGLSSRWINECRDRALPGWFAVTNFGGGFRGVWETSNQNRAANSAGPDDAPFISTTSYATNASFQGATIIVRTNVWNPAWENAFSLSAEFSVGDNDGDCLYFRYLDRSNWFRVTLCGNDAAATTRPVQGVSVQKRANGWFSVVPATYISGPSGFFPDPLDTTGYKRFRVTVNGTNDTFEVRVIGWNAYSPSPDWDPASELIYTFTDNSLPSGRIGVGSWGQGAFGGWNATNGNPVGAGVLIDNIVVQVDGTNAFVEDWETAPLHSDFPPGWENPYASAPAGTLSGDWHVSAHGTIASFTLQYGTPQTGTTEFPRADGQGPILLAPPLTNANYILELGIHPLDDGGMGFVYDFVDTNNFSRVLFNSQVPVGSDMLQGLNVSRKVNGIWQNIVVGDNAFIYPPGRPFDVRFANNNGACTLTASLADDPATVYHWNWTGALVQPNHRVGLAIWDMPDAHYSYFRAYSLPAEQAGQLKITRVAVSSGNVLLDVAKPNWWSRYHVLRASTVDGTYVKVASDQLSAQYTEPQGADTAFYRLELVP